MTQGSATRRDFKLIRGTTLRFSGIARKTDGAVIDLTGGAMTWRIGPDLLTDSKISITSSDDITIPAGTGGEYSLLLTAAMTAELEPDSYSHRAEVTEAGGDISTVLQGQLNLLKDLP